MEHADGAWIDGDGPDNGAWMCTDRGLGPSANWSEEQRNAYGSGWSSVLKSSREYMIAKGGFEYNCFTFVTHNSKPYVLPVDTDDTAVCAWKLGRCRAGRRA